MMIPDSRQLSRLATALLGVVAVILIPAAGLAQANPNILVSADWLAEHRDDADVVMLQVVMRQTPDEVIPGSHRLGYMDVAPNVPNGLTTELAPVEDLVEAFRAAGVSNDSHVVIIGDPGLHPARIFMTLDYLGHGDHTSVLDGGMGAWKAAGGAVVSELSEATPGNFEAHVQDDMLVSADWINERLDDPDVTLVDARPEVEYTGERPGRDNLRGGHIPGAYNLYWDDLTEDGDVPTLKELDEVKARYQEAGASMEGVVVSYCLIGMRASYTYMISRYLGFDTKFYDGSWNEWGARDDLPVVPGKDRR